MNASMIRNAGLAAVAAASVCTSPAWAWPPVWLTPGTWGWTMGTTAAQLPELAGMVIFDRVRPFEIRNGAGVLLFKGKLQDRIVRSTATDDLHFYYRVRDTVAGLPGDLVRMDTANFSEVFGVHADYRPDGLGTEAPTRAVRNASGAQVRFVFFPATIDAGESSKFCFVKPPGVEEYEAGGSITLWLATGESVTLSAYKPDVP